MLKQINDLYVMTVKASVPFRR